MLVRDEVLPNTWNFVQERDQHKDTGSRGSGCRREVEGPGAFLSVAHTSPPQLCIVNVAS